MFLDLDECSTEDHGCHVNASCTNAHGSFNCKCLHGFEGDGKNCTGNSCEFI